MSTTTPTIAPLGQSVPLHIRKTLSAEDEVERLSAKFPLIRQEEAKRQGEAADEASFDDLAENAKEYYRAQARYILDHYFRR